MTKSVCYSIGILWSSGNTWIFNNLLIDGELIHLTNMKHDSLNDANYQNQILRSINYIADAITNSLILIMWSDLFSGRRGWYISKMSFLQMFNKDYLVSKYSTSAHETFFQNNEWSNFEFWGIFYRATTDRRFWLFAFFGFVFVESCIRPLKRWIRTLQKWAKDIETIDKRTKTRIGSYASFLNSKIAGEVSFGWFRKEKWVSWMCLLEIDYLVSIKLVLRNRNDTRLSFVKPKGEEAHSI